MQPENLSALLLFISACSAGGVLCGVMAWITAANLMQRFGWHGRMQDDIRDTVREVRNRVIDLSDDLREVKRLAVERDKMLRAAAGVKLEVK